MKTTLVRIAGLIAILAVFTNVVAAQSTSQSTVHYVVAPLPLPPGYSGPAVVAMNDAGQVVGYATGPGGIGYGILWSGGQATVFPGLGGDRIYPQGINSQGVVAGYAIVRPQGATYPPQHSFIWSSTAGITDLGISSASAPDMAVGVDNGGTVAGNKYFLDQDGYAVGSSTYTWNAGTWSYLPATGFVVAGLNPTTGNLVGDVDIQPALYSAKHGLIILQSPPGGGVPLAVNANNEAIGHISRYSDQGPAYWGADGSVSALPVPAGLPNWPWYYHAKGINDNGEIVGNAPSFWATALYWATPSTAAINLNSLLTSDQATLWQLTDADAINNRGQIAGMASYNYVWTPYIMTPAPEPEVDADHDGKVRFDGTEQTSNTKPFSFWLNNDEDGWAVYDNLFYKETEQDDLDNWTKPGPMDWQLDQPKVERDLEDFTRLTVSTNGLGDQFAAGTLAIGLQWLDSTDSPSIKLFPAMDPGGSMGYLTDPKAATQQLQATALSDARYTSGHTVFSTSDYFILPTSAFQNLTATDPNVHLLFEGCTAGKGRLHILVFQHQNNTYTKLADGDDLWLELKDPAQCVERWSCEPLNLTPLGAVSPLHPLSAQFPPPSSNAEHDYVLFVHGYNMQEYEKQRWIETTYKRLWQVGFRGRVGGFTWPCSNTALPFDVSEERAWQSATELVHLLTNLKSLGYRVHILAHSQGNVVATEALRLAGPNSRLATTYVASQAALAAHCYDSSLPYRSSMPRLPNPYGIYWAAGQSVTQPVLWPMNNPAYAAETYVWQSAARFVNIYNPRDYALTGDSVFHPGWMIDQWLKPDFLLRGYWYTDGSGYHQGFTSLKFPDDRYQIFSYAARARSPALGAVPVRGVVQQNVDLSAAPFEYGGEHRFHSGEFRSYAAARFQYWKTFMAACDIATNP